MPYPQGTSLLAHLSLPPHGGAHTAGRARVAAGAPVVRAACVRSCARLRRTPGHACHHHVTTHSACPPTPPIVLFRLCTPLAHNPFPLCPSHTCRSAPPPSQQNGSEINCAISALITRRRRAPWPHARPVPLAPCVGYGHTQPSAAMGSAPMRTPRLRCALACALLARVWHMPPQHTISPVPLALALQNYLSAQGKACSLNGHALECANANTAGLLGLEGP